MTTDEKIVKILESMDKRLEQPGKDIAAVQQGQARTDTALDALAAGQKDIREHMPTTQDVEETVEVAKAELKADSQDATASIMQQTKRQGKWIEAIAEKTETSNSNKKLIFCLPDQAALPIPSLGKRKTAPAAQ